MLKELLKTRKDTLAKARGYAEREMDDETKQALAGCMELVQQLDQRIALLEQVEEQEEQQEEMEKDALRSKGRVSNPLKPEYVRHAEKSGFSIARAIADVCEHGEPRGVEREVTQEITLRTGASPKGQFYVPFRLGAERRDLTTTTGTGAIDKRVA